MVPPLLLHHNFLYKRMDLTSIFVSVRISARASFLTSQKFSFGRARERAFISIGRAPETKLFAGALELDGSGYIVADETTRTALPGVFAVGDVRTKPVRQIVTAVADGATAVHFAEEYLAAQGV